MRPLSLSALFVLLLPIAALAQTVNPTNATVPASPDHATVAAGVTITTGYKLFVVKQSAPTVVLTTVDVGKPTVDAGGMIDPAMPASFLTTKNTALQFGAIVYGPGGPTTYTNADGSFRLSNPFVSPAPPASGAGSLTAH